MFVRQELEEYITESCSCPSCRPKADHPPVLPEKHDQNAQWPAPHGHWKDDSWLFKWTVTDGGSRGGGSCKTSREQAQPQLNNEQAEIISSSCRQVQIVAALRAELLAGV